MFSYRKSFGALTLAEKGLLSTNLLQLDINRDLWAENMLQIWALIWYDWSVGFSGKTASLTRILF